jgi:hypothetical protein
MVKVSPYYSTSPEDMQRQRYVYHDHEDCPDGRRIKPENRQPGTDERPRCDACIALG